MLIEQLDRWGQTSESKIRLCHKGDSPPVKRGQTSKSKDQVMSQRGQSPSQTGTDLSLKIRLRHKGGSPLTGTDLSLKIILRYKRDSPQSKGQTSNLT
ncbi:hypothetical protein PilKf_02611 [Pillotina sp. SPG140]